MMIDSLSRNMKRGQYQKDSVLFFFAKTKNIESSVGLSENGKVLSIKIAGHCVRLFFIFMVFG